MTLSLATKYYQVFLAQGVCLGLGGGIIYVPSLALVAASFTEKRQIAIAIVTSGTSIGEPSDSHLYKGSKLILDKVLSSSTSYSSVR